MLYGDQHWPDIRNLDKSSLVVVCPLAATEQHGHHLPLLTDTYLATAVAERAHKELGEQILLLPTQWLGASDHHLDFPGTVSLPNTLYIEMIKNVVRSLAQAGFGRIFFLNGHGGNVAPGEVAITEMANSSDTYNSLHIALASYWSLAADAMNAERHGMESPQLTHACEYETSMMLSLRSDLVVMQAARGCESPISPPPAVRHAGRFNRRTATGALGSPEHATAEKGESLLAAITGEVVRFIRQMADWPMPESLGP